MPIQPMMETVSNKLPCGHRSCGLVCAQMLQEGVRIVSRHGANSHANFIPLEWVLSQALETDKGRVILAKFYKEHLQKWKT